MERCLLNPKGRVFVGAVLALIAKSIPVHSADAPPQTDFSLTSSAPAPVIETAGQRAERYEAAKAHYMKAVALRKKEDLAAAVAEYLEARRIYPSWSAVAGAARCLQLLFRYDEALDLYEVLLREFADALPKNAKIEAQKALIELRDLVGTIAITGAEPDAAITIDGRSRGTYPPPTPFRVPAGTHIVRVYMEGFDPFETTVDVAGNQIQTIDARMRKLEVDESGRLRVAEVNHRLLDVIIDGNLVGKTPWEGPLRDGKHTVVLAGEKSFGTQPAAVSVERGRTETLQLSAQLLEASLHIKPSPPGAAVAIDGVNVGRGVWQGKLRKGKHRIDVAAEGFILYSANIAFVKDGNRTLAVKLRRDPLHPLWKDNRGRFFVSGRVGPTYVPTFGGVVARAANAPGVGVSTMARAGYRFPSGLAFGIDAGYGAWWQIVADRQTRVTPRGLGAETGTVDDTLSLHGVLIGASGGVRIGKLRPVSLLLGVGAMIGRFGDHREGFFKTNTRTSSAVRFPSLPYAVDVTQRQTVVSLYVAPEVRVGVPLREQLELSLGLRGMLIATPNVPKWIPRTTIVNARTSGLATFDDDELMGQVVAVIEPSIEIRYEF